MASALETVRLVGRSAEIETATQALANLEAGRGSLLLLSGEPGIGKSTLARLVANSGEERGLAVYWGFAWEAGGAPAYWPWTQLLRSLTANLQELDTAGLGQILGKAASSPESGKLNPGQAQFLLLESVRQLLMVASRQVPLVLVLEDLHAADADSLHLLNHLARHVAAMPVLIIGTFRELEAKTLPSMESLWRSARDATLVRLHQFDESEVREFLQTDDSNPSPEKVKRLHGITQGNPLFLTELVDYLERAPKGKDRLPENVQQVIRQQLELLPGNTVTQLTMAAIIGRDFCVEALASMQEVEVAGISEQLQAAHDAGIVRLTASGNYRFAHVLHRDVLYQAISLHERQELHLRFAAVTKAIIDRGDDDCWSTYASHLLAAGPDHREDAVTAWRQAAARARERLAFDDAANSLEKALDTFGEGPNASPEERCRLLLDYAEVLQLSGQIATGQRHCREAFSIAEVVRQPALMADAVLTWGSSFVAGKIDEEFITALQTVLSVMPQSDIACRAKVQARLAAAQQPSACPAEPMEMAREAISLARSTGDEKVVYEVLRSAISALMDFAPAAERLLLNKEFSALAEKFGDFSGQFRSHLRLIIDASAIPDRDMMDRAIEYCRRLARRSGLPHYQWRVASIRAMQASMEGRFADALALIDEAQRLADQIDDIEARLTLPLQRFLLLCEWDSPETTPLAAIEAQLAFVYESEMAATRVYVEPFVAALSDTGDDRPIHRLLGNNALVERSFSGGDRYSLAILGELATRAGDHEIAARVYEHLENTADGCATTGLMAACWCGPIDWTLGLVLCGLGRHAEAIETLKRAMTVARTAKSRPYIARCHAALADAHEQAGDSQQAISHRKRFHSLREELQLRTDRRAPAVDIPRTAEPADEALSIIRKGEFWEIRYRGEVTRLRDSKGLQMLAELASRPDAEIHVLDLSGAQAAADSGDAGVHLDDKARSEYQQRIRTLNEELDEATELADLGRADAIRSELDFLTRELSRAFGLGGRKRRASSAAERARVNVRRRLSDAIKRISEHSPATGKYLENTIKTGAYCRYAPT